MVKENDMQRATLDLLKPKTYEFELVPPVGDPMIVEMRDLTLADVLMIETENQPPSPPVSGIEKDASGNLHNIHNYEDANYKVARENWARQRMTAFIAKAWVMELPDDPTECFAVIDSLATWARSGLWQATQMIMQGKEDAVRMRPFHGD